MHGLLLALGSVALLALAQAEAPPPTAAAAASERAALLTVRVVRVIDGDTIEVCCLKGRRERVRYIGINTPETRHPTRGEEPGGRQATAVNRHLVEGKAVRLELDVQERDPMGACSPTCGSRETGRRSWSTPSSSAWDTPRS
jgi:endonuclease YncB( thermonuclease family)